MDSIYKAVIAQNASGGTVDKSNIQAFIKKVILEEVYFSDSSKWCVGITKPVDSCVNQDGTIYKKTPAGLDCSAGYTAGDAGTCNNKCTHTLDSGTPANSTCMSTDGECASAGTCS